ncbi:hypothetical protein FBU31_002922 [Coemansia sp. 'formosensis']|nr:hypothetical protein FBU31_002922 [Coemansia sp. 'formosensis']
MTALSPFQILPMLIVEKVIECLEGFPRNGFDADISRDVDGYNKAKRVKELLWVSERWRVAAFSTICDNCEINFDNSSKGYSVRYPPFPAGFPFPQSRAEMLVKRVVVMVSSQCDICDEKSRCIHFRPNLKLPVFPSAATLMVCLDKDTTASYDEQELTPKGVLGAKRKSIVTFARALRRLTPAATGLGITFYSYSSADYLHGRLRNLLISELCCGTFTRLYAESLTGYPLLSFKLPVMSGLTSITHGFHSACIPFAILANRNAGTLQNLILLPETENDWRALIYGGTQTPVVYNSLTSLFLNFDSDLQEESWAAIEDVVSFPALRKLDIVDNYPLDDDLLFRGNGRTLQSLTIPPNMVIRNTLRRFGVLERSGVTRMDSITIKYEFARYDALVVGLDDDSIERQVHRMVEVATRFTLEDDTGDGHVFRALFTAPRTATVQHLKIRDPTLDDRDIIEIISALPSLVSLTCTVLLPMPNIEAIPAREHPSSLLAEYHHLSGSFIKLALYKNEGDDENGNVVDLDGLAKEIAHIVVQLAVLCPNFRHVDNLKGMHKAFSREIAKAMTHQPYLPYADSLRRLIFPDYL